jgi:hypothetical protein
MKLISKKTVYLRTCAPSATRTRDLLLRRHYPNVARHRPMSPDVGSSRNENRWTSPDVAWCRWALAPSLAPRDIVSGANFRTISALCLAGARPQPTASSGLAGPARHPGDGSHRIQLPGWHGRRRQDQPQPGPDQLPPQSPTASSAHGRTLPRSVLPASLGAARQCAVMHDVRSTPGRWPISTIRYN